MSLYYISVTIHVLAAIVWLGGMFFLALVGAPVLRRFDAPIRAALFQNLGLRFRTVGWVAVALLVVTGVSNLSFRGLLRGDVLASPAFWTGLYGRALALKLLAACAMLVLSVLHDFVIGPAVSRQPPECVRAQRLRRAASWLARVNAVIGLVLVGAAVRLARGG